MGISNIFAPPTAVFATTIPFSLLGSTTYPMLAGSNPKLFRVSRKKVSGRASVNEYIQKGVMENSEGVEILTQSKVLHGDGGIALGQVYYISEEK